MSILARLVFWCTVVIIVGHAVVASFNAGDAALAVTELIFFPFTYLIYPWVSGLWWLLLLGLVSYWISTAGGLEPVD